MLSARLRSRYCCSCWPKLKSTPGRCHSIDIFASAAYEMQRDETPGQIDPGLRELQWAATALDWDDVSRPTLADPSS